MYLPMRNLRPIFLGMLLVASITMTVVGQNTPRPPSALKRSVGSLLPSSPPPVQTAPIPAPGQSPDQAMPGAGSAQTFISQAQSFLSEGRLAEAKEALRTAIRLEPMNLDAWNFYDQATELDYVNRSREERINPVVDRDIKPTFSIERVENFEEFGTVYLVGELRNVSDSIRQNIEITGILLDEEKQELARSSTLLKPKGRGLFPNERSLFEIPFANPPPGVKSFRVRVTGYD